jgi:hypothetical protein
MGQIYIKSKKLDTACSRGINGLGGGITTIAL